jgi:eukaryotic-like serine/threonine-protein kinase
MRIADILPSRYRDPELLAEGGMGEIYRATDEALGRVVAVKLLAARYAADEVSRNRFTREALAAARLSGAPHAVSIFDVGEHNERPFFVMEYLAGGSLQQRLRSGPVATGEALDWLEDAARALDAAHERGIVHRDVKPGNLLFDDRGAIKVADFGIARAVGEESVTKPGTVLGTAGYLAPEQAMGERATPASDRYALAVVAYELLTGRRPFERGSPTAEALAHVHDPVPSACRERGGLPCELDPVFERALAKHPNHRYSSCAEFVADLRAAFDAAAGTTRALPVAQPSAAAVRPAPPRPRWPLVLLLLAALLAAGGAAVAWALARDGGGDRRAVRPRTVVHTVTTRARGVTVQQTVTQTIASPAPQPTSASSTASASASSGVSGAGLNDAGYSKMRAGDYQGALPLLEQAVAKLQGTGSLAEAYASYNLAYTRYALGSCDGVLDLVDRSEAIQGHRGELQSLRAKARKACAVG